METIGTKINENRIKYLIILYTLICSVKNLVLLVTFIFLTFCFPNIMLYVADLFFSSFFILYLLVKIYKKQIYDSGMPNFFAYVFFVQFMIVVLNIAFFISNNCKNISDLVILIFYICFIIYVFIIVVVSLIYLTYVNNENTSLLHNDL